MNVQHIKTKKMAVASQRSKSLYHGIKYNYQASISEKLRQMARDFGSLRRSAMNFRAKRTWGHISVACLDVHGCEPGRIPEIFLRWRRPFLELTIPIPCQSRLARLIQGNGELGTWMERQISGGKMHCRGHETNYVKGRVSLRKFLARLWQIFREQGEVAPKQTQSRYNMADLYCSLASERLCRRGEGKLHLFFSRWGFQARQQRLSGEFGEK